MEHFASQYAVFAEGQVVVLDGERVVGQGSGFFTDFDFEHPGHTFREICDNLYFRNHDWNGAWYYGADVSVHPDYRGGSRQAHLRGTHGNHPQIHKRGMVGGGMLPGYVHYKQAMLVQEYVNRVVGGELFDPTLSFQLKQGFVVRGLLENYLEDSALYNWATLIVWENPAYSEASKQ